MSESERREVESTPKSVSFSSPHDCFERWGELYEYLELCSAIDKFEIIKTEKSRMYTMTGEKKDTTDIIIDIDSHNRKSFDDYRIALSQIIDVLDFKLEKSVISTEYMRFKSEETRDNVRITIRLFFWWDDSLSTEERIDIMSNIMNCNLKVVNGRYEYLTCLVGKKWMG